MSTTVLLVDDHALIRQGLCSALTADGLDVVGEAASLAEGRAMERKHSPDVAVIDIQLGDGSGLDLVRESRHRRPEVGLVVLTAYDDDDSLLRALDAGASAFVLKSLPSEEVIRAVRAAHAAPTSFTARDLGPALRRRTDAQAHALTARERTVLSLLAEGLSVAEIAGRLFVSSSTAKVHLAQVYSKLGVNNRTQAVLAAERRGLLPPGV